MLQLIDQQTSPSIPITTINYTLDWPHLSHPTSTTFITPHFDLCTCPRNNKNNSPTSQEHIYTRYTCTGPTITFVPPTQPLWVLQTPQIPFNILRPANAFEQDLRLQVDTPSTVQTPSTTPPMKPPPPPPPHPPPSPIQPLSPLSPLHIHLLTGPSPRGRYQAHATTTFLRSMPTRTRLRITGITLLLQPYEEDADPTMCAPAFAHLAAHLQDPSFLPAFATLHLAACQHGARGLRGLRRELASLGSVLRREGVRGVVEWLEPRTMVFETEDSFLAAMAGRGRG